MTSRPTYFASSDDGASRLKSKFCSTTESPFATVRLRTTADVGSSMPLTSRQAIRLMPFANVSRRWSCTSAEAPL